MNRKLFSVFFSVLVCSTLGQEHLKALELQRSHHVRSQSLGFHHARANPDQCSYICPVPKPSPETVNPSAALRLVFIEETKVFAVVNSTTEVATVLQIGEPIALIANGKTGVSIVVNIETKIAVYYPAGSNGNLWRISQSHLEDYLRNLGPLTKVNNWKDGQTSKLNSLSKDVKNIIISIIKYLDSDLAERVDVNPDSVVSLVTILIKSLLESSDVVQLLLDKLKHSVTVIFGGLSDVVNLVVGLKSIGKHLQGGLPSIINNRTDISLLLGENSGFTRIFDLFFQVGDEVDLTKVLGNMLQCPKDIMGLAARLDRGKYIGIAGITAVIYNVQLYADKKISLEALIDVLIQVQAYNGNVKITKEYWNSLLNWYFVLAKSQTSHFNTDSSWSTLNRFFQDIKNDRLIIKGINVSAIINILITTSGNVSLSNIVKILLELKPVVALTKIIATLYFRLLWFIISGQGLVYIHLLLPNIPININISSSTSIIKQLLSNVNVLQIVSYLLRLDVVGAITHLPAFGPILNALDDAIKSLKITPEVTVASSLKAVGSILNDLKELISFGLGRGGNAPSDSGIAGLSTLGGGITISIKTTWTSSEEWSSSNGGSEGPSGSTSQSQGGSDSHSGGGGHKGSNGLGWSLFGGG